MLPAFYSCQPPLSQGDSGGFFFTSPPDLWGGSEAALAPVLEPPPALAPHPCAIEGVGQSHAGSSSLPGRWARLRLYWAHHHQEGRNQAKAAHGPALNLVVLGLVLPHSPSPTKEGWVKAVAAVAPPGHWEREGEGQGHRQLQLSTWPLGRARLGVGGAWLLQMQSVVMTSQ